MMIQGQVLVDDDGSETFIPNDATNATKLVYQALMAANSTMKVKQKTPGGPATYVPPKPTLSNPPTDQERAAYQVWLASKPVQVPPPPAVTVEVIKTITPDAATKQKTAEMASAISVLIPYIVANATAVIPNDATGDNLMKDSTGANCKHPATQQTLRIA